MHCVSFELSPCLIRSNTDQAEEDFLYQLAIIAPRINLIGYDIATAQIFFIYTAQVDKV
jgi:hypothetical protein